MLSRSEIDNIMNNIGINFISQRSHTGAHGDTGPFVVSHVEVVYPSESDSATNPNVHIQYIRNALEMIMKRKNVMIDVVQVSIILYLYSYSFVTCQ